MLFRQPQLCKTYKNNDVTGWFVEPKINGNRGIVIIKDKNITVLSRNNKPIYNTKHIQNDLLKSGFNNVVLDGEFYVKHAILNEDWSTTTSILRTQSKHVNAATLRFFIFDMIPLAEWLAEECRLNLNDRKSLLQCSFANHSSSSIVYVNHRIITCNEDVQTTLREVENIGFEGIVLKHPYSIYEYKRSSDWLKLKSKQTSEYPIVRIVEGKGKYVGSTGAIVIDVNGVEVHVGTGIYDEERKVIWKDRNKLSGTLLEVSYQTKSKNGSLIFPVFQRIRWDLI